jgi:DNA invertase Pin-like site-specific DNA recombinase
MKDQERNVAFYIRVSTDRQAQVEEGSLKNQEQMLHAELTRRNEHSPGWGKYVKSYVDEGLSGKDTNRPAFRQMMQDIELGNVQAVMFTELSRLSRSLKDFLNIFEFAQKYRCDLVCLKTEIDTTSPYKSLITKILMIFAEFEREMTSRRTALNAYERSKRGLANGGVAPLGYKRMKQKKGHLIIDEKEKQIVQDIFVTYIRLESIRKTTDHI